MQGNESQNANGLAAAELLGEMKKLMELRGENPFKIRAFDLAIDVVQDRDDLFDRARLGTLTELPGIGRSIAETLTEFFISNKTTQLEALRESIPAGLQELSKVRGVGPKKAMILINELGIRSIAELEYACKENRLVRLKGFGSKVQEKILTEIAFRNAHRGFQKLSEALDLSKAILAKVKKVSPTIKIQETGGLRRRLEVLNELEFLVEWSPDGEYQSSTELEELLKGLVGEENEALAVRFHFASPESFGYELARTTATQKHWIALGNPETAPSPSEEQFYRDLNLPWIPPETRETGEEVDLARNGALKDLLPEDGIRGIFHNHTTRSDGRHTLEEMVEAATHLGYEYIGISDHSQTAAYAQGLKLEGLREQRLEVRSVQEKFPGIRIFWGIESDILGDGSLDYDDRTLAEFDFVVASIHSRFQMDQKAMTDRVLKAVQNPYTRFLGHPTGRLLLGRKSFDLNMEEIIHAAAENGVAIELNANPSRLDIDWRWGPELRKHSTFVSINPDAHSVEGMKDTSYGIMMARKALLPAASIVNTRSAVEVAKWLEKNR